MAATPLAALLILAAILGSSAAGAGDAHPGYASKEGACGLLDDAVPAAALRLDERRGDGGRRIVDITHAYMPEMPAFATGEVVGPVLLLRESMENGSEYNLSELHMSCHVGTHVDAPGHMNQDHFAAARDVDKLDLDVLNDTFF